MVSDFGKLLDPVADKLTQMVMLSCLIVRYPWAISLVALLVITMVDEEYGIVLPPEEMRKTNTIQELFDLVASKH